MSAGATPRPKLLFIEKTCYAACFLSSSAGDAEPGPTRCLNYIRRNPSFAATISMIPLAILESAANPGM